MPAILPFFVGTHGGSGTVTSIDATTPNSVLTITGGPITTTGIFVFTLNAAIESVGTIPSSGIVAFDSAGPDFLPVTLTGTANQIAIANATGVGGNPTFSLPNAVFLGTSSAAGTLSLQSGSAGSVTLAAPTGLVSNLTFTYPAVAGTSGLYLQATGATTSTWAAISLAGRTITGTVNQITVVNGDGVSGNPTISLPTNVTISGTYTGNKVMIGNTGLTSATTAGNTYNFQFPLSAGINGQVLANIGSSQSAWVNPNALQSISWWNTYTLTGQTDIIIQFPSGPIAYEFQFINMIPGSDQALYFYPSTDGGITFLSSGVYWSGESYGTGALPQNYGVANDSSAQISGFNFFVDGFGTSGTIKFWPGPAFPATQVIMDFDANFTYRGFGSAGATKNQTNGNIQGPMNAVKFDMQGVSMTGTIVLYLYNQQ